MGGCESTSSTGVVNGAASHAADLRRDLQLTHSKHAGSAAISDALADIQDQDEREKAATKIQATFRGHQTRKQLAEKAENGIEDLSQMDLSNPELSAAATRIQASFRGHKVRRDGVLQQRERELYQQIEDLHTAK